MGKLNTVTNGKGSEDRVTDFSRYRANHDDIDWGHGKRKLKQLDADIGEGKIDDDEQDTTKDE